MTRAEQHRIKKALEDFVRDAVETEASARKALEKTGIFTKAGRISRHYGGSNSKGTGANPVEAGRFPTGHAGPNALGVKGKTAA